MVFSDDTLDDNAVLHIASFAGPGDLLSLALTCRRLGSQFDTATVSIGESRASMAREAKRQKANVLSLMDQAARCEFKKTTEEERECLPLREGESWMGRYNELLLLRQALTFDQLVNGAEGEEVRVCLSNDKSEVWTEDERSFLVVDSPISVTEPFCSAVSNCVMRAGKHFAQFTVTGANAYIKAGVLRPRKDWQEKGLPFLSYRTDVPALDQEFIERWGDISLSPVNHCVYDFSIGYGEWSDLRGWNGTNGLAHFSDERMQQHDVVGMLLDLDGGTLAVYKNGTRLGVLKDGLAGEYCWVVKCGGYTSVKISRGVIPA